MYQMLSARLPFEGSQTKSVLYAILDGRYKFPSPEFDQISYEAKDLISRLICIDVEKRLSAKEALQHPWIVHEGKDDVIDNRYRTKNTSETVSGENTDDREDEIMEE